MISVNTAKPRDAAPVTWQPHCLVAGLKPEHTRNHELILDISCRRLSCFRLALSISQRSPICKTMAETAKNLRAKCVTVHKNGYVSQKTGV
jgi:hypothetical protein